MATGSVLAWMALSSSESCPFTFRGATRTNPSAQIKTPSLHYVRTLIPRISWAPPALCVRANTLFRQVTKRSNRAGAILRDRQRLRHLYWRLLGVFLFVCFYCGGAGGLY